MGAPDTNGERFPPEFVEEMKRQRRRERWSAFLTPLITLAAIVLSIGFLMFILRTCDLRARQKALTWAGGERPPGAPLPLSPRPQPVIG
jgi:hypothetical protein